MNNVLQSLRKFSTIALVCSTAACAVEGGGTNPDGTKSFSIADATHSSFATVTIQSDDPADLALGPDDFELIAITAEQAAKEVEEAEQVEPEAGDEASEEEGLAELDEGMQTELSDEVLADGVVALEVVERDAPDYRAPFANRYYYSQEEGLERTASIRRQSAWHRVYGSIYYSTKKGGSWGSLVDGYKLKNKETLEREGPENTYQMRIKVRARKTKHYTTSFNK